MNRKREKLPVLFAAIFTILILGMLSLSAAAASEADLTYEIKNGKVTITGCDKNASGKLVIPSKINGGKVTAIADAAFEFCRSITDVVIPSGVTDIGDNTFHRCSKLKSVSIPDTVTSIGSLTFCDCVALTDAKIPDSVTSIGNCAFFSTALTEVKIPDKTKIIDTRAFEHCYYIKDITIPDGVTSIGEWAFAHDSGLESVTIGKGVKSIGHGAFHECENIKTTNYTGTLDDWTEIDFTNSRSNPMLYSTNLYVNGNLVTDAVINKATKIKSFAFYNCDCLESIVLPDGVTSIDAYSFRYSSALKSILIPDSVTEIGEEAFFHCYKLVISGTENSYAQSYAEKNGIPFNPIPCTHPASSRVVNSGLAPSCLAQGYTQEVYCSKCGKCLQPKEIIPATGHRDNNNDGNCDNCGLSLKNKCSCNCHKGGFTHFIWSIANFFNRIFGKNQYCACGDKHW